MQILVLEDSAERQKVFRKFLCVSNHVAIVSSVDIAKALVKNAKKNNDQFDIIFIDHDLDDRVYVDSEEENTGYQFAKWLAEQNIEAKFITHSLNPVGAKNICGVLKGCKYVPFLALKTMLEEGLLVK